MVFDLDGTLVDSLADLALAVNQALVALGYPPHPTLSYRQFIGDGMSRLVRRALPAGHRQADIVARGLELTLDHYSRCWNQHTHPYDEVPELLDALFERQVPVAVLTNKPDAAAHQVVASLLPRWAFAAVVGTGPAVPDKPDPTGALGICSRLGVTPESCAYVGDSGADMQTARNAGMRAVGAGWGFRTTAELKAAGAQQMLTEPLELLALLAVPGRSA